MSAAETKEEAAGKTNEQLALDISLQHLDEASKYVKELKQERRELKQKLAELDREKNELKKKLMKAEQVLEDWQQSHEFQSNALLQMQVQKARERLEDARQEVQNAEKRLDNAEKRLDKAEQVVSDRINQINKIKELKNAEDNATVVSSIQSMFGEIKHQLEIINSENGKRPCIALSEVSGTKRRKILQYLNADIEVISINEPQVEAKDHICGFNWSALSKNQQAQQYIAYLAEPLKQQLDDHDLDVVDVSSMPGLLTVNDERLPFDHSGGTDVLIMRKVDRNLVHHFPGLRLVIELKKNLASSEIRDNGEAQALAELIAADILTYKSAVVLLTDLNAVWIFMWLGPKNHVVSLQFNQPYNAFVFMRKIISTNENEWTLDIPYAKDEDQRQPKRAKFDDLYPVEGGSKVGEMLEQYRAISSELGPDVEMAREIGRQFVREMPIFRRTHI